MVMVYDMNDEGKDILKSLLDKYPTFFKRCSVRKTGKEVWKNKVVNCVGWKKYE